MLTGLRKAVMLFVPKSLPILLRLLAQRYT